MNYNTVGITFNDCIFLLVTEKTKRSRESESDEEKKSPGSNSPEPKQMSSLLSV